MKDPSPVAGAAADTPAHGDRDARVGFPRIWKRTAALAAGVLGLVVFAYATRGHLDYWKWREQHYRESGRELGRRVNWCGLSLGRGYAGAVKELQTAAQHSGDAVQSTSTWPASDTSTHTHPLTDPS